MNLDDVTEPTEAELLEWEALIADDPELKAEIERLVAKIKAEFAAIPTIEIKVQPLDESDNPAGEPYTITSDDGVLNLGYSVLTSAEFLLLVQAEQYQPGRAFVIDDDWDIYAIKRLYGITPNGKTSYTSRPSYP